MREVKDKEGSEQKEIMDEISDLDALLPDLDAKVITVTKNNFFTCESSKNNAKLIFVPLNDIWFVSHILKL